MVKGLRWAVVTSLFFYSVLINGKQLDIFSNVGISFLSDVRCFFLVSKRCSNKMEYTVEPHATLPHIHTAKYFFSLDDLITER